jgi:FkbM family methyltransferase
VEFQLAGEKNMRLKTNQTCHVTAVVFWEGCNSYEYSEIFQDLFKKIDVFFDVGSNIGYYSIMAGTINSKVKVFAFDPSPGPFAYLSENIELNELKNVSANQLALSSEPGEFSFHIAYNSKYPYLKFNSLGGSGHLSHVRENPTLHTVKVKATTLDLFAAEQNLKSLDLIKLDVEEAEHLVLAGSKASIQKFRPIVVCEIFSTQILDLIKIEIISLGYKAFLFQNMGLVFDNLSEGVEIEKIENYFFVPEEKIGLVEAFIKKS